MQEPGSGRKGRAAGRLGQSGDALRPADPDLFVEDQSGNVACPVQLTGAAGQHDAPARDLVEPARLQPIADELKGLLDARRNDPDEQRFRHMIDVPLFLLADLRDGNHLALVSARRHGAAKQRLHAFGVSDWSREPAGNVVCDVTPADRHIVGKNQVPIKEHADRRRSPTHVDDGYAETDLVFDKAREAGGIRADDECVDVEMRAPDARAVVTDAGGARGHHMHVDPEPLAEHAARVADPAAIVDREPDRDRMDDLTIARLARQVAVLEHPTPIGVPHLTPGKADLSFDDACRREATRQVWYNALYRLARHLLGGVHRIQNGGAGRFEVDNGPVAHAARGAIAYAAAPRVV